MSERKESTIGKEFTLPELFRFVAPPVVTRLLVSLLSTLDDSLFVSRFLGQNALAAFSVAMPWFMFVDAIGMMFSSVSVICSIKMGEGKHDEAKSDFSTSLVFLLGIGAFLTLILSLFLHPILRILGETEILMPYAEEFFRVSRFYLPLILINYVFNSFYVIAGKPKCSMYASAINMIFQFFFDWLFIVKLKIGIAGAAYANLMGSLAVTLFAVVFYSNRSREVCFVKPQSRISALLKLIFRYGRMQAITSLAISFGSYVTNHVQLHIGGEEVVAAYTIVSNVTFMFMNSFFGLISSTSPLVSYASGEQNARKGDGTYFLTVGGGHAKGDEEGDGGHYDGGHAAADELHAAGFADAVDEGFAKGQEEEPFEVAPLDGFQLAHQEERRDSDDGG